jgi:hypothetical protein
VSSPWQKGSAWRSTRPPAIEFNLIQPLGLVLREIQVYLVHEQTKALKAKCHFQTIRARRGHVDPSNVHGRALALASLYHHKIYHLVLKTTTGIRGPTLLKEETRSAFSRELRHAEPSGTCPATGGGW